MKTHLLIEIDHSKPLPEDLTDDAANRVYTMLHARGVACDVAVKVEAAKERDVPAGIRMVIFGLTQ